MPRRRHILFDFGDAPKPLGGTDHHFFGFSKVSQLNAILIVVHARLVLPCGHLRMSS